MADGFVLPSGVTPVEAIEAFERRTGRRLTWSWREMHGSEHEVSFTVAKVTDAALLEDIHRAVDDALRNGRSFEEFRARLEPILRAKGWWGRQERPNPVTGEMETVQLGSRRRLRIIYDTNLRVSHKAGQQERIQRLQHARPYLRRVGVLDDRIRPSHRAMHGIILPVDHPFWDTHTPPDGWGCRCRVVQLSDRDLRRRGWSVSGDPRGLVAAPDRGWDYRPGAAHVERLGRQAQYLYDRVGELPADAGRAVIDAATAARLREAMTAEIRQWAGAVRGGATARRAESHMVGLADAAALAALPAARRPVSAGIALDGALIAGAAAALEDEDFAALVALLEAPAAVLRDPATGQLIYAGAADGAGRVLTVRVASMDWVTRAGGARIAAKRLRVRAVARVAAGDLAGFELVAGTRP